MDEIRGAVMIRSAKTGRRSTKCGYHKKQMRVDDRSKWRILLIEKRQPAFKNSDFKDRSKFSSCSLEFLLLTSARSLHAGRDLGLRSLGCSLARLSYLPCVVHCCAQLTELLCS